jgi:hypothetical protein
MTAIIIVWICIGALIAGASDPDTTNVRMWRMVVFAVLWPLFIVAAIGVAIGKRLGV